MSNNNINYYRDPQVDPYYLQPNSKTLKPDTNSFKDFYEKHIDNDNDTGSNNLNYEMEFYNFLKGKVSDFLGKSRNIAYDHIVLLLGAGASVVEGKSYGKTMGKLAQEILGNISQKKYVKEIGLKDSDLLTYNEILEFIPDDEKKYWDKKENKEVDRFPEPKDDNKAKWNGAFPLEELISQLDFFIKGNKQLIKSLEDRQDETEIKRFNKVCNTRNYIIYEIFENVKYDNLTDEKEFPFNHMAVVLALTKLLKSLSEKLTVVTTNYDLAIEKSLAKRDFTIFNGYNLTNNSIFDESSFDWVLSKKVNHINTEEVIYKPNMINLFKIHGSINWIFDGENTKEVPVDRVEQILLSNVNSKKPSKDNKKDTVRMIFPSTNKYMQSYEEPYFDLMARFQEELHKSNTLLVTSGFSFGDDHISRMVINAIEHNSSLKCLFTDYGIYNSKFGNGLPVETDNNVKSSDKTVDDKDSESEEKLYGNENWRELDSLRNEGYDIAFLKATMNDKEHGLAFFLRG